MILKVGSYCLLLIARDREKIREALWGRLVLPLHHEKRVHRTYTAAAVVEGGSKVLHRALRLKHCLSLVDLGSAYVGQPRAAIRLRRRKNIIVPQATIIGPISESAIWVATD